MGPLGAARRIVNATVRVAGAGWVALALGLAALGLIGVGCASGEGTGDAGPGFDGEVMDGDVTGDAGEVDSGIVDEDAGSTPDAGGGDAGPETTSRTCESCEVHDDCATGSFCVSLSVGGRACVPGCVPDLPSCPRDFRCVLDIASGVDTTVCLPIGGTCCVDEDGDDHGQGVGCLGPDCNDLDPDINPAADEICDEVDQDCDGVADDPPTDCLSGRCAAIADGTYTSVTGADCAAGMCASGTVTSCALFTCEDGGALGNRCATTCTRDGVDDELLCVEGAHCTAGACIADIPNGMACSEDVECASAHCENGFCCDSGACCSVTSDCPGGGGVTTLCDDPRDCQGTRGETDCTSEFRCRTVGGIADDTACGTDVQATTCGLHRPAFCNGTASQSAPACPTSCTVDADCVDAAHCDLGFCVPDRPPGGSCSRNQNCQDGLTCTDGVCCTSPCTGLCVACNLFSSPGSCAPIPAGADPAGECPGFSCMSFYDGFGPGENSCFPRQNVSDGSAVCNGGAACLDPATACSTQPRGAAPQITCNAMCQMPTAGTCTGMTPGACTNLDNPADQTTCGVGACARTVQRCTGGAPTTCTMGSPTGEVCNGLDDDCDGVEDDGADSVLCPPPMGGTVTACVAGDCRLANCPAGTHDVDGNYTNGCECTDDAAGNTCGAARSLGSLPTSGTSANHMGRLIPGQEDWLTVNFPLGSRGPAGGAPSVTVTHSTGGANPFSLQVTATCSGGALACTGAGDPPNASSVTSWSLRDNQSSGATAYSGPHSRAWPTTLYIRVTRSPEATTCTQAQYTLTVTR